MNSTNNSSKPLTSNGFIPNELPLKMEHEIGFEELKDFQARAAQMFMANPAPAPNAAQRADREQAEAEAGIDFERDIELPAAAAGNKAREQAEAKAGIDFEKDFEPSVEKNADKPEANPEFDKILRDNLTTEDLLYFAGFSGSINKTELDNIQLDAKNEGKTLNFNKNSDIKSFDKETKEEIKGNNAGEITVTDKEGKVTIKDTVTFDSSVPMTQLPPASQQTQQSSQQASPPANGR